MLFSGNWAQIVCVYPPYKGGMGHVAEKIKKMFPQIKTFSVKKGKEMNESVVYLDSVLSIGNASLLRENYDLLNNLEGIILHYPFFGAHYLIKKWKKNNSEKKLYVLFHMEPNTGDWRDIYFNFHKIFFKKSILNLADKIIVATKDYADYHISPEFRKKTVIIPFNLNDEIYLEHISFAESREVVMVSNLDQAHSFKNIDNVIKYWKLNMKSKYGLTIVGKGKNLKYYSKLAKSANIAFLQAETTLDLQNILRQHKYILVAAKSSAEAFSLVGMEAQAVGTPMICFDIPGVREVQGMDKELIIEKFEDLNSIMEINEEKWKLKSINCRARVLKSYSEEKVKNLWENLE